MSRKVKYSNEVKLKACKEHLSGKMSAKEIVRSIGIRKSDDTVRYWERQYEINGIEAFSAMNRQKNCCVLYDHEGRDIVDMIKNRQLTYLFEYFDAISEKERGNVKIFVSDMYDACKTICKRYLPKALYIIDLF